MTGPDRDRATAMEAEFDVVAEWTREAVDRLGPDHAIPAACRGSASPAALDWLGAACGLTRGSRLLDAGGGMGGPAAYAVDRFGARPLVVEPMLGACRTAGRMFGLPTAAGTGQRLPVATGSMDAVWCLGVLCTTTQKAALLGELLRVLRPGGALGLLVLVAQVSQLRDAPEGNSFPTAAGLDRLLADAGTVVADRIRADELPATPDAWTERADRVERQVADLHGADPRHAQADDQEERMGRLLGDGALAGHLIQAVRAGG